MHKTYFFLISPLIVMNVSAAEVAIKIKTEQQIDEVTLKVIDAFKDSKFKAGMDLIKPYYSGSAAEIDALAVKTTETMAMIEPKYGKTIGFEKIRSCKQTPFYYRVQFVQKFEKSFLLWNFAFYSAGAGWNLTAFNFEDKANFLNELICKF